MSNLKLTIDLLPKGAWGNDLSITLSEKDWDTLRNFAYEKANNACAVCGNRDGQLEAHEVWDFDIENKVQTLKDIVALCPACHGVKHMRNSQRIGYGEQAKMHFLKVNKCNSMTFANHFAEAEFIFEERNKVLRWKLKADLSKFGGKGIEVKERDIPIIKNPYDGVDWATVRHFKTNNLNSIDPVPNLNLVTETVILQSGEKLLNTPEEAIYFIMRKQSALPPKICSIAVDNYSGAIIVACDRVNKVQWFLDDKIIKVKYNNVGKFITKFNVKNQEGSHIRFRLIGEGGETVSQKFGLIEVS